MTALADTAIFKISRELTKNEISARSDRQEYLINEMKFLSATERSEITAKIRALKTGSFNDAALAENITVLSFIWTNFSESLSELFENGNSKDIARAKESYTSPFALASGKRIRGDGNRHFSLFCRGNEGKRHR